MMILTSVFPGDRVHMTPRTLKSEPSQSGQLPLSTTSSLYGAFGQVLMMTCSLRPSTSFKAPFLTSTRKTVLLVLKVQLRLSFLFELEPPGRGRESSACVMLTMAPALFVYVVVCSIRALGISKARNLFITNTCVQTYDFMLITC